MSKQAEYVRIRKSDAERLIHEIGKVRYWMTGFVSARGNNPSEYPPGFDGLRQAQIALKGDAK